MKYWKENTIIFWIRMSLLMINIVLSFVFRGDKFVLGYTYGVNLIIILESLGTIIVKNHNRKWALKPFKDFEKEMKKVFEKLDKLYEKEK